MAELRRSLAPADELRRRIGAAPAAMERRGLTHRVVYADREHFAYPAFLTHFEPRFEEALLILERGARTTIKPATTTVMPNASFHPAPVAFMP